MLRKLVLLFLVACITLALAPQGRAQVLDPTTLHYVCTGTTTCAAGATTLVTGSTLPTFNITIQPGNSGLPASSLGAATLYVIALVPSTAPALSFSINGQASSLASGTFGPGEHLWSNGVTGFFAASHFSTANADFNAYASASGQSGTTPTGFNVYVVVFDVTVAGNASGPNWNAAGGTLLSVGSGGITGLPSTDFPVGTVLFAAMTSGQDRKSVV